ncbi:hypothetical protein ACJX0J_029842, partial [Zea mays]
EKKTYGGTILIFIIQNKYLHNAHGPRDSIIDLSFVNNVLKYVLLIETQDNKIHRNMQSKLVYIIHNWKRQELKRLLIQTVKGLFSIIIDLSFVNGVAADIYGSKPVPLMFSAFSFFLDLTGFEE